MDIKAYEYMFNGLTEYNNSVAQNYGNVIVKYPTTDTTYPHTIFTEIRNTANPNYNGCFERVANVGYRVDIYAKTKGNVPKSSIAREIALIVDKYLTNIGLTRVSFNAIELENKASIYHIIMTYSGNLYENKRKLI